MSRNRRDDSDYSIEVVRKALQVLEAFEGARFEPVTIKRIHERTKLPYDTCRRIVCTFKEHGLVVECDGGWRFTPRFIAFCQRAALAQLQP